jgi:filamentous hemagglutinin family protein
MAIDWASFSIGSNASVTFDQPGPGAIALNRVLGSSRSEIYGKLNANGQVFLLNPNGILFGKGAEVNVGGLVASTLSLSNDDFMAGRSRFAGSAGAVDNDGSLTGGYVALLGGQVSNRGTISARLGTAVLAAGSDITLDFAGDGLIGVAVNQGALHALVENKHLIQADGGTVILTAKAADRLIRAVVNNTGVIEARRVENHAGVIKLLGDMENGIVEVGGTLDASAANGEGGFIETSGAKVKIADDAFITTKGSRGNGTWLIDPYDFTIAASGGDITGAALGNALLTNDVTIQTTSGGANCTNASCGAGASGNGDIFVNDTVTWNSHVLTLNAYRNIVFNANLNGSGTAGLALLYGQGAVAGGNTATYRLNNGARINLASTGSFSTKLGSNGAVDSYTIITTLGAAGSTTGTDLQGMAANLTGKYVLGSDIDASSTSGWNSGAGFAPIGSISPYFAGVFDGLGHTITGLTINRPAENYVGLFGRTNLATIRNVGLLAGSFSGMQNVGSLIGRADYSTVTGAYATSAVSGGSYYTGGLLGQTYYGSVSNVYASGNVSGNTYVGGAIGANDYCALSEAYATGTVSGNRDIGGLSGTNFAGGTITNSFATGNVSGTLNVGGLVGENYNATISKSYAAGTVSSSSPVGGLVGSSYNGTVVNSFWDVSKSGAANGVGGGGTGGTGLTTAQMQSASSFSSAGWSISNTGGSSAVWRIYDGQTYPLLRSFLTPITVSPTSGGRQYDGTSNNLGITYSTTPNANLLGWVGAMGGGKDVGTYSLSLTGAYWSSQQGYDVSYVTTGTMTVTPRPVTFSGSRSYDGTTAISASSLFATNVVAGDLLNPSGNGILASRNVGNQAIADLGTLSVGNSNYTLTGGSVSITPATLNLYATTDSKTYDGGTSSAATVTYTGLQSGDSLSGLSQSYASKNVLGVNGSILNVNSGYTVNDGNGGNNYVVTAFANPAAGTITPATLNLYAATDSKTYDGGTASSGTVTFAGLKAGDTLSGLSQSYASKNALGANGSTLNINGGYTVSDGNGGANYNVVRNSAMGTITPATLNLYATTDSRAYDGGTSSSGAVTFAGLKAGDTLSGLSQSYASKNALGANGSTLNVDGGYTVSDGNGGANYTGTITPATLTLYAATDSKTYDGGTASSSTVTSAGLKAGDTVSGLSQSYASKHVLGTNGSTLNVDGGYTVSDGNGGANYTVVKNSATGTITPATLTLYAATGSKTYDGGTASSSTVTSAGLKTGDSLSGLSQRYASKNVLGSNGSTLLVNNGYTLSDGNGGANYVVIANSAAGTIAPATLTLSAAPDSKTYDGGTSSSGAVAYAGLKGSDSLTGLSQRYASKDALGTGRSTLVVDDGYALSDGNGGANYSVVRNSAAGTIAPRPVTVTGTRVYDGTTNIAGGNLSVTNLVPGDAAALSGSGTLAAKNVGLEPITGFGSLAVDNANYTTVGASGAATVTPRPVALKGLAASDKKYDGTTTASATAGLSGVLPGDAAGVTLQAQFSNPAVGPNKTVTVTAATLTGPDAANYQVATGQTTTADISGSADLGPIMVSVHGKEMRRAPPTTVPGTPSDGGMGGGLAAAGLIRIVGPGMRMPAGFADPLLAAHQRDR